jgi:hypothetical protein
VATTDVDICNLALVHVGSTEFLGAIDDDDTAPARILAVVYRPVRDSVLERLWWPFATKEVALGLLDGVTRAGWAFAYALPTDLVACQYISNGLRRGAPLVTASAVVSPLWANSAPLPYAGVYMRVPFAIEASDDSSGRILLTDQDSATLVYTASVTESAYTPTFVDALSYKLAARLAFGLLKKPPLADMLEKKGDAEIAKAWAAILREQQEDVQPDSEFVSVRG